MLLPPLEFSKGEDANYPVEFNFIMPIDSLLHHLGMNKLLESSKHQVQRAVIAIITC